MAHVPETPSVTGFNTPSRIEADIADLQHTGTMNRGRPSLSGSVVPDSGTGELKGLSGTMTIDLGGGKHAYRFDYTIT